MTTTAPTKHQQTCTHIAMEPFCGEPNCPGFGRGLHAKGYRFRDGQWQEPSLFDPPPVTELVRRTDPPTSKAAAAGVQDRINALQRRVLEAFHDH
ncbi:MAG TPA: hypothetical protein VFH51_14750, partial [Myxococcota bacterium]|nr:hypothetical protein [Myxococcota bacterium]